MSASFSNPEITKCLPKNSKLKIDLIKNNFTINRKYYQLHDIELFKNVIIGRWLGSPYYEYIFSKDGELKYYNMDLNFDETGKWKLNKEGVAIKFKDSKNWEVFPIDFIILKKWSNKSFRHVLMIYFKKGFHYTGVLEFYFD